MQNFIDNIKSYFATPLDACLAIADMIILSFVVYFLCAFLRKNNATRLIKIFAIVAVLGVCIYSMRDKMPATGYICSFAIITVLFAYFTMFPHEFKRGLWKIASPRESAGIYTAKYTASSSAIVAPAEQPSQYAAHSPRRPHKSADRTDSR